MNVPSTFDLQTFDPSSFELVDTHCHIHDSEFAAKYGKSQDKIVTDAIQAGVRQMVCVGTDLRSSREAVAFCREREQCYPTVAIHPHEAADKDLETLQAEIDSLEDIVKTALKSHRPIIAIGECGLDYYYHVDETVKKRQKDLLKLHLKLARKYDLPLIFHIRNEQGKPADGRLGQAFSDFFAIYDDYKGLRGVVHSFSSYTPDLKASLQRGLYIGLNGIMTFTKDDSQLEAARNVPLKKLVMETDAPFLTPVPHRGTMGEPKHVTNITKFLGELRGESQALLADQTTKNAKQLFSI